MFSDLGGVREPVVLVERSYVHLLCHGLLHERPHHEAAPSTDQAQLQEETRPGW